MTFKGIRLLSDTTSLTSWVRQWSLWRDVIWKFTRVGHVSFSLLKYHSLAKCKTAAGIIAAKSGPYIVKAGDPADQTLPPF